MAAAHLLRCHQRCLIFFVGLQPTVIASRASPPLLEQSSSKIRRIVDARRPSIIFLRKTAFRSHCACPYGTLLCERGDLSEFLAARTCASCWLDKVATKVCSCFPFAFYHARMARRAQHLRFSLRELCEGANERITGL